MGNCISVKVNNTPKPKIIIDSNLPSIKEYKFRPIYKISII